MNIAVIYQSRSGHTEEIAGVIAATAGVTAVNIADKPDLEGVDLLFLGMGVYAMRPDRSIMKFIDSLSPEKVRKVALFTTSATCNPTHIEGVRKALLAKGILTETEACLAKGQFLFTQKGHPNDEDFAMAQDFAARIIEANKE